MKHSFNLERPTTSHHSTVFTMLMNMFQATVKRVRRALCQMNPGLDDNEICMTSTMPRKLDRQNVCYGDAGSPLIGEVRQRFGFYHK